MKPPKIVVATVAMLVMQERKVTPPWGLFGGKAGAYPTTYLIRPAKEPEEVRTETLNIHRGYRIEALGGGGGGYGDPHERDPQLVALDVRRGYVSPAATEMIYCVALTHDGEVDKVKTAALRDSGAKPNAQAKAGSQCT